jgi:hypothetical protein
MTRRERPAPRMTIRRTPPVVLYVWRLKSEWLMVPYIILSLIGWRSLAFIWFFHKVPA